MPKGRGLYTRKGANGRRMYFRDGKLISEKSYKASMRARKSSPRKTNRKTARPRRNNTRRNKSMARYRRPAMPHPSVTGLASGLAVANYLDKGPSAGGPGVVKNVIEGKFSSAFSTLSKNAINLTSTSTGKLTLSSAIVLATGGALARKYFPNVKLGGSKFYFRI